MAKVFLKLTYMRIFLKNVPIFFSELNLWMAQYRQNPNDQSIQYWESKRTAYIAEVQLLENEIIEARKKDFEETGFKSFENKEFDTFADVLIDGEFWKDEEANAFIAKYAGVEIAKEFVSHASTAQENKAYLSQKLSDIFLRSSKDILKWTEQQDMQAKIQSA